VINQIWGGGGLRGGKRRVIFEKFEDTVGIRMKGARAG